MNATLQDTAFNRGRRLSEGGVFSKLLAEGAAFNRGQRLSGGGVFPNGWLKVRHLSEGSVH